jgi:hypothetical protein
MKKICALELILTIFVMISCTSLPAGKKSEISVMFGANAFSLWSKLNIYIDGKKVAAISSGETTTLLVSQGEHVITVDWRTRVLGTNIAVAPGKSVRFNTNSGKIIFYAQLMHKLIPGKEYDLTDTGNFYFSLQLKPEILDQVDDQTEEMISMAK